MINPLTALEFADLLDLSALEPGQDLEWNDVREIIMSLAEGLGPPLSGPDELDQLTDEAYAIAAARLSWRRGRPAGHLVLQSLPPS
jgi:hypothetical protein